MKKLAALSLTILLALCANAAEVSIYLDTESPMANFAAEHIKNALVSKGDTLSFKPLAAAEEAKGPAIILKAGVSEEFKRESFQIERKGQVCTIDGAGPAGLMYGGLEAAEIIRGGGFEAIRGQAHSPYMAMRGVKFNIPLDVRTPSYTDVCDSAQYNIPEVWSMEFWREFIDLLALYRYNYVSLWSMHPFPSMVRVPEYPDIALQDVRRSTGRFEEYYSGMGMGFDAPEIMEKTEIVKKMTMDEKIAFWREVMAYGRSRNVDFYIVTWNVFTYGTGGKYGITDSMKNTTTQDYFRKSVEQTILTYPDLAGIGITTGENMQKASAEEKEEWVFNTYAQGILDALNKSPGRKIRFIHRQHMTGAEMVMDQFKPLIDHPDIDFIFSFKYAKAHVYSATKQPYHTEFVEDIGDIKTIWTLRNDDIYYFRWGAPDFVREFISNIPQDVSQGYYYGSDQWIWGREFLQKDAENPRRLEIDKHWYQWMLWGRLGYNPQLSNERIKEIIAARFPQTNADKLFAAWQQASMVYPRVTGFHWGALDFQWYIEGCRSRPHVSRTSSGFHDVENFISLKPHKMSGYQSIPDYVRMVQNKGATELTTPIQLAEIIENDVHAALKTLKELEAGESRELKHTLADIETICHMGLYYASKIRGATMLALARKSEADNHRKLAVEAMTKAADHWKDFMAIAKANHKNPLWTNRVGHVDWEKMYADVLNDIEIAKSK